MDPQIVGWNFFKSVLRPFSHFLKHVVSAAVEVAAPLFGVPPGVAATLAELLLHAHAGDPHAKAKVRELARDPKYKAFLQHVSAHAKQHPHFAKMKAHAHRMRQAHALHAAHHA